MTTCKLAQYFSSRAHVVATFSFASQGHMAPASSMLFHATMDGSAENPENQQALRTTLEQFEPDVVINHMPYDRAIGDVLKERDSYFLLGCLRNTLYSVKGDLNSYVSRNLPGLVQPLVRNSVGRRLLLARHRRRHAAELNYILDTYDRFVMFGQPNLEELKYFVPEFDETKVALVPNSIPGVAEAVPRKDKRLLWLGRVSRDQKRVELIPEVWRLVCEILPDWELDVVGNGPDLEWLQAKTESLGLQRVSFHGRQSPEAFFARSPVFFMTSSFEGFPNTLVEAQSFGAVPVIFDSYPVASWIVEDGKNGFLIDPFDVKQMAERIVSLTQHPGIQIYARNCLTSAARFDISNVGAMWEHLFKEMSRNKITKTGESHRLL